MQKEAQPSFLHPQILDFQIVVSRPIIVRSLQTIHQWKAFRWGSNLNFEKLTLVSWSRVIYIFLTYTHQPSVYTNNVKGSPPPPPPPPHFIQTIFIKDIIYMQSKVLSQLIASKIKVCLHNLCVLCIFVYINTHTSIRVWTYTDLTVRLRLSCHRFNSISWCITVNWRMHRILNL